MKIIIYPTFEEALFLHAELINRFGGHSGIRDRGLLESALARPRSGYYETLFLQAAALMHSLVLNHCFVDGNKRIAFALTLIFLDMNDVEISVSTGEGEKFLIKEVISNKVELGEIAKWLEKHASKNS